MLTSLSGRFVRSAFSCLIIWPTLAQAFPAEVIAILDGDTVIALDAQKRQTRCRLYGIDAPEKAQAYGQVAKQSLSDMVFRRQVDVQALDTDRYGRTICRLTLGGVDINLEQVTRGMAWVYRRYTSDALYLRAEDAARAHHRGLWSDPLPVPPWDYRRAN